MFKNFLIYIATHRFQLSKFIAVGFTTFGIYLLTFHIFFETLQLDYRVAASCAYIITITSHFLLHRTVTYRALDQAVTHSLWKYSLMLGLNYLIMMIVMWVAVNLIQCSPYIGIIISTAITSIMNYLMMKYFVFESKLIAEGQ